MVRVDPPGKVKAAREEDREAPVENLLVESLPAVRKAADRTATRRALSLRHSNNNIRSRKEGAASARALLFACGGLQFARFGRTSLR